MTSFRFIHCSDLHIDSPFKGLGSVRPELAARLRDSTFQAFQNIVDLAIREKVDAVVIAGDIYDGADKSLQAQLKFRRGLKELADACIPCFIAHGNHDPLDSRFSRLEWPELATVFSGKSVEGHTLQRNGKILANIFGISYPTREVKENLALKFPDSAKEGFAIGVLHANVGHNPNHDDYAPCSLEDLVSRKMDYWALGHIHGFKILRDQDPAIVYPGNTQARHKNEAGRKGCCLVTLHADSPPDIQFVATDTVRFVADSLRLDDAKSIDDVLQSLQTRCESIASTAEGRDILIHLSLTGRTQAHAELKQSGNVETLSEEIQSCFDGQTPAVWINLTLNTQGTYDVENLRQGNDFIADLLALYEESDNDESLDDLKEVLKPMLEDWKGRKYLDAISGQDLQDLLLEARNLTLDQLVERQ